MHPLGREDEDSGEGQGALLWLLLTGFFIIGCSCGALAVVVILR